LWTGQMGHEYVAEVTRHEAGHMTVAALGYHLSELRAASYEAEGPAYWALDKELRPFEEAWKDFARATHEEGGVTSYANTYVKEAAKERPESPHLFRTDAFYASARAPAPTKLHRAGSSLSRAANENFAEISAFERGPKTLGAGYAKTRAAYLKLLAIA